MHFYKFGDDEKTRLDISKIFCYHSDKNILKLVDIGGGTTTLIYNGGNLRRNFETDFKYLDNFFGVKS